MNKSNLLIFGAGEIRSLLIQALTFRDNKVIFVSDNRFGQINNISCDNLEIIYYEEILDQKLKDDKAIFAWIDSVRLINDNHAPKAKVRLEYDNQTR